MEQPAAPVPCPARRPRGWLPRLDEEGLRGRVGDGPVEALEPPGDEELATLLAVDGDVHNRRREARKGCLVIHLGGAFLRAQKRDGHAKREGEKNRER